MVGCRRALPEHVNGYIRRAPSSQNLTGIMPAAGVGPILQLTRHDRPRLSSFTEMLPVDAPS